MPEASAAPLAKDADADAADLRQPAGCADLFRVFTRLALQGFGGVLPIAHRELVERERWVSPAQFVDLLTVGQVLPGPNIVNISMILGYRWFGLRGALAATAGMLAIPLVIVLVLAVLYQRWAEVPAVAGALRGMGAVAAGLVVATALKLGRTAERNLLGRAGCAALALLTLAAVGVLRWPLAAAVLGLGSAGMAAAAWRLHRADQQPPGGAR
jgi:chromate transporter